MYTCAPVCVCACMYVCSHQASTLPCLPMSTLKAAWSAMNKAILEHLWFDSPALRPTCRSHSTRSWHANCTDSRKHPASLESDSSLQHRRSKSIQLNDLHELQFHFIMKTRLHARSPAWSGTFIARKQVQKGLEQLGRIECAVSTQLCSHWHIFRFFGILSCWFLDALSESFATRKRNLKVPEAGFAGQARIPGTSPHDLWPTTSAVLLNISYHTSIHAVWSYWVTGQGQPAWPRRPYSFTRMPKRKVLKARVRLSGTVHSVEIRDRDFTWSTFKSCQSSHQLGCW